MKKRASMTALAAALAGVFTALPAGAQDAMTTTAAAPRDDSALLWVWVWILVVGVIAIVGGASVGNRMK